MDTTFVSYKTATYCLSEMFYVKRLLLRHVDA